jgi:anti-sigma-K factor RskA
VKAQLEQRRQAIEMKTEQDNKMKNQIIIQQKRFAQLKIEEDKKRRIGSVQRDIDRKLDDEARVRQMKEQEVMQMELLEMELIKKL